MIKLQKSFNRGDFVRKRNELTEHIVLEAHNKVGRLRLQNEFNSRFWVNSVDWILIIK